jgi:hypothetical protein
MVENEVGVVFTSVGVGAEEEGGKRDAFAKPQAARGEKQQPLSVTLGKIGRRKMKRRGA